MDKAKKRQQIYILGWAKKITLIKSLGGKCSKCGNTDIFVLDFHHIDSKTKSHKIASMHDGRITDLVKEANKCILLCANCHAELHCKNKYSAKTIRRFLLDRNILECSHCGYGRKEVGGLDFHHINASSKKFTISEALLGKRKDINADQLEEELLKCVVLCKNCHRREHVNIHRFNILKDEIYIKMLSYKETPKYADREKIKELYLSGHNREYILKELSCTKDTLNRILLLLGFRIRQKECKILSKICIACKKDFKTKVITQRFCCKKCSGKKNNIPPDDILIDMKTRLSYAQMAKIYNVGSTTIFNWMKKAQERSIAK